MKSTKRLTKEKEQYPQKVLKEFMFVIFVIKI